MPADAMSNDAGHIEKRPVDVFRVCIITGKCSLGTDALGFGAFRFHRRIVPAIGVLVQLLRRSLGSPDTTDGTRQMSGLPSRIIFTAVQERKAEFTSI